jgi:hypothetical protein
MGNVLGDDKKQQVVALGRLGWPLRRIEAATGVRRETASAYLKAAGIAVRPPGSWGHAEAKPAKEASTDSAPPEWPPRPERAPQASACEPYRDVIVEAVMRGRNAVAIYQDLSTTTALAPATRASGASCGSCAARRRRKRAW